MNSLSFSFIQYDVCDSSDIKEGEIFPVMLIIENGFPYDLNFLIFRFTVLS